MYQTSHVVFTAVKLGSQRRVTPPAREHAPRRRGRARQRRPARAAERTSPCRVRTGRNGELLFV